MTHAAMTSRNRAMALVSRINRWMIAGSVALTGAFALLAAHAFPGHAKTTSGAASAAQSASSTSTDDGASTYEGDGSSSLQQPSSTPSTPSTSGSSSSSGPVVSGGS